MDIRFVSSFTDEDEVRFAPVLLKTMSELLVTFPIAYSVRIETTGGKVFQQTAVASEFVLDADAHAGHPKREIAGR